MPRLPSTSSRTTLLSLAFLAALPLMLGACQAGRTHAGAWRLEKDTLAVEMLPTLDRYIYFGPEKGPNLIHVKGKRLKRGPASDGSYTFFGGLYTWAAPQNTWFDDNGQPSSWPPDPAMDIGPVRRAGGARGAFEVVGPQHRSGLREHKTFTIDSATAARFSFTLHNDGPAPVPAGTWTNLAVRRSSEIAIALPPGAEIWGSDDDSVTRFNQITGDPDPETGWAIVKPWRARWSGGVKVYIAPPPGEPIEIAVCHKGYWLHRALPPVSADELEALRNAGAGPVALYIQPGRARGEETIIEAELYGPIVRLDSGESTTSEETWTLIRAKGKPAKILP